MVDRKGKEIGEGYLEEAGLELEGLLWVEDKERSHQMGNTDQQPATVFGTRILGDGSQSNQGLPATSLWMTLGTSPH